MEENKFKLNLGLNIPYDVACQLLGMRMKKKWSGTLAQYNRLKEYDKNIPIKGIKYTIIDDKNK